MKKIQNFYNRTRYTMGGNFLDTDADKLDAYWKNAVRYMDSLGCIRKTKGQRVYNKWCRRIQKLLKRARIRVAPFMFYKSAHK